MDEGGERISKKREKEGEERKVYSLPLPEGRRRRGVRGKEKGKWPSSSLSP